MTLNGSDCFVASDLRHTNQLHLLPKIPENRLRKLFRGNEREMTKQYWNGLFVSSYCYIIYTYL